MAQGTNAVAFTKLKPLENNDIGAIVEEHVRYWTEKKDNDEAQAKAQQAQSAKFQAQRNKEAFDLYEGLSPDENKGFLNSQIVSTFEKNKPYYRELAERYASGDLNAGLKLQEEKEKIANIVKLNKTYGDKAQELALQQSQGLGNEYLDEGVLKLRDSFGKGNYKMNDDWSLSYYNPNTRGIESMNTSAMFDNNYLSSTLNKKADFTGNGATIANNLLDSVDRNEISNENTKVEGMRLVNSLFGQDGVEARSWYGNVQNQGLAEFNDANGNPKPFGNLNQFEKNRLADLYYENNVVPNIKETTVDTGLEDALKVERLKKLREERKSTDNNTTITASTDEVGNVLNNLSIDAPFVPSEGDKIFNLKGNPISFGVQGNSNTNITYTDLIKTGEGKVYAVGKKVEKINEPIKDESGENILGSDGSPKTRVVEKAVDVIEFDPRVINNISRLINNNSGDSFDNLNQLSEFLDTKSQGKSTPSKTPTYKGLDADGNPIFE